jgi:LPXTG-site transpeptidase (sortase) family protein
MKTRLRAGCGALFIFLGFALILGASLAGSRAALRAWLAAGTRYLPAAAGPELEPLALGWLGAQHLGAQHLGAQSQDLAALPLDGAAGMPSGDLPTALEPTPPPAPVLSTANPLEKYAFIPDTRGSQPQAEPTATPTPLPPTATPPVMLPPDQATFRPSEPVVRLAIPSLKIKRAVIEIGLDESGQDWDTDRLFANQNRPDLVGHLEGSALPGEAGNTVLVGHNYDYNGSGVFVNLGDLEIGDEIRLFTESGQELSYEVVKVKTVPWSGGGQDELERHYRFIGPSPDERLTLVTCGGANIGFFNKRVYVVALPVP